MATTKKALALAEELKSELMQRQSALAVELSFDTDGNPLVKVGTGVSGTKGGLIKIAPIDWPLAKDILGLASPVYTPHVIKIAVEANEAGAVAEADVNDWASLLLLLGPVINRGTRVEVYESANGTGPTVATFATAAKGTFEPSMQYGMLAGQ